ncbi:MAG: lysophospholipid acyltransferase family protein [Thermoanaerobaculales bacterium]|jgi:lysophospholipid acyltransferase (LPLAT)-like uncharacterized protein|nr:lysophospholipid acyltransferase family protein [Thermoanaerobaculales bacterium]
MPEPPAHRRERILGHLAWLIYRLYSSTFRYRLHGADPNDLAAVLGALDRREPDPDGTYLCAFWHQDELALLPYFRGRNLVAMVSDSRDGTIMATALELFGYLTTRGSSTRGGAKAFVASLRMIRQGFNFVIAVDGPRGPIYRTKEGVVRLAEKSGRPVVPFRAWPERAFTFQRAWNRARLPLPFTRVHIVIGRPGRYTCTELDDALNSLSAP